MNPEEIEAEFSKPEEFKEIWVAKDNGNNMCALTNKHQGWLMHIRFEGDTGFSSRNHNINSKSELNCKLNNGQVDSYPKHWFYPLEEVKKALLYFAKTGERSPDITWNED